MAPNDRRTTILAVVLVAMVSLSLRAFGFRRTYAWIHQARLGFGSRGMHGPVADAVNAIQRVRRYAPWTGRCLATSFALAWLLHQRGLPVQIHIGVRLHNGVLKAHSWAVHSGSPLAERREALQQFSGWFVLA